MYALVDGNCFYCSCERVFDASLEGKPVVVLSNNDGCVISLSDEAKTAGVEMGKPIHFIRDLVRRHDIKIFSSNYTLYGDMSRRMMNHFTRFVPEVEVYSIDEAFLNMGTLYDQDLLELGIRIRQTVKQCIGIPTCVGIAPTKTLAKLANRYAKKFRKSVGVHWLVGQELINEALDSTKVEDIWGIGRQHAKRLHAAGFHTGYDLATRAPTDWVRKNMSVVGERLLQELRGVSCLPLESITPKQKNITCSRSFGSLQTQSGVLENAMATYTATCAAKLRQQQLCASSLHVFVETNQFRTEEKQYAMGITLNLPVPTSDTGELIHHALAGLRLIFKDGYNYQKCGVVLQDLVPEDEVQMGLFDQKDRPRTQQLMKALDAINQVMGAHAVHFASQGNAEEFRMKTEYRSRRYTTRWNELCMIKF